MTTTRDLATMFTEVERSLALEGRAPSSVHWMGIGFRWEQGTKRDGCVLKRHGHYGRIVYADYRGRPLTRDEALAEVQTPRALRQALRDIEGMRTCQMCHETAMGEENLRHWQRICYFKPTGLARSKYIADGGPGKFEPTYERVWFDICDHCITAIATA